MPRYTNTADVGTVQVKAVTKANADKVFPAIVRRFLGVQSVPM